MVNMDNCIGKTIASIEYERYDLRRIGPPSEIRITFTDGSTVDLEVMIDETINIRHNVKKEDSSCNCPHCSGCSK